MNRFDLRDLHETLGQLQDDLKAGRWIWSESEKEALVIVMDAIMDTSGKQSPRQKSE